MLGVRVTVRHYLAVVIHEQVRVRVRVRVRVSVSVRFRVSVGVRLGLGFGLDITWPSSSTKRSWSPTLPGVVSLAGPV